MYLCVVSAVRMIGTSGTRDTGGRERLAHGTVPQTLLEKFKG